jgi:hypothetical protein
VLRRPVHWFSYRPGDRLPYPVDMAAFALGTRLIAKRNMRFRGLRPTFQEIDFLVQAEVPPWEAKWLCRNYSAVFVWHTRTEAAGLFPKTRGYPRSWTLSNAERLALHARLGLSTPGLLRWEQTFNFQRARPRLASASAPASAPAKRPPTSAAAKRQLASASAKGPPASVSMKKLAAEAAGARRWSQA